MSIAFAELETATQNEVYLPRKKPTSTAVMHCLVVAEQAERREFFAEAARAAGWEVIACDDANSANHAAHRYRHALAIVDLDGLESNAVSRFRDLAEQLSLSANSLLMVCGTDGNTVEEIWARQLGVWLYLSGVDSTCDIASLCGDARQVVQKLNRQAA